MGIGERRQIRRIVGAGGPDLVTKDFNATDISDAPFGWNVGNWDMRDGLLSRIAALPNVVFEPGLSTASTNTRSTEARVTLSDGRLISCQLLIAADGRDSAIRKTARIAAKRSEVGQLALSLALRHI